MQVLPHHNHPSVIFCSSICLCEPWTTTKNWQTPRNKNNHLHMLCLYIWDGPQFTCKTKFGSIVEKTECFFFLTNVSGGVFWGEARSWWFLVDEFRQFPILLPSSLVIIDIIIIIWYVVCCVLFVIVYCLRCCMTHIRDSKLAKVAKYYIL